MSLKSYIKDVPDFPKPGIVYKDIQPLLADVTAFQEAIISMSEMVDLDKIDYFVGIESRGFIFASALAAVTGKGLKIIRKAGKLPDTSDVLVSVEYELEYGTDMIEMLPGGGDVVIVDDVYATGGTIKAAQELCKFAGYNVQDTICLLDIGLIKQHDIKCLISY